MYEIMIIIVLEKLIEKFSFLYSSIYYSKTNCLNHSHKDLSIRNHDDTYMVVERQLDVHKSMVLNQFVRQGEL